MNIETKANVGDTIFYLKRINRVTCPLCNGDGVIILAPKVSATSIDEQIIEQFVNASMGNVKKYNCPECGGKGTVKATGQAQYEVGKGTVIAIEATMNQGNEKVVYRVVDSTNATNRTLTSEKLYLDQEDAEKQCRFMNLERRLVPLECLQIPPCFAKTIPCNEKLMKRLDEWRNCKKFETEIYVDENLNLFDGYTAYLMYRMLGIFDIPVVIWPENERSK